jgi:hypothetical protein
MGLRRNLPTWLHKLQKIHRIKGCASTLLHAAGSEVDSVKLRSPAGRHPLLMLSKNLICFPILRVSF